MCSGLGIAVPSGVRKEGRMNRIATQNNTKREQIQMIDSKVTRL